MERTPAAAKIEGSPHTEDGVATFDGRCVLVYDIGGSHISAAVCAQSDLDLSPVAKAAQPQSINTFLETLSQLASQVTVGTQCVSGAVLAMPGPFDYVAGVSWMRHKMPYLYGISVRHALAERLGWKDEQVQFLNDAAAFLLGEIGAGAARDVSRTVGITLGTGIGSAFAVDGNLVMDGPGVPHGGEIWNLPFEGGIVEDLISTRSIQQGYKECTGHEREVAEIAAGAAQDPAAVQVFQEFGRDLGRVLRGLLLDFAPEVVVLGGGISHAAPLFLPAAHRELRGLALQLRISLLGDRAPLVGAGASWFSRTANSPEQLTGVPTT
jgi:glucokinase